MDRDELDPEPSESDAVDVERVLEQLETLERTVDEPHERREVQRTMRLVDRLPTDGVRERIRKLTRRDVAEAFVGSIIFSLPLLVEDGVYDIGDYFVATPALFVANALFVVAVTAGLLYYAEFRQVAIHRPLFGIIPRRLVVVVLVSITTATLTMTMWGRLDWVEPTVAAARISVVWAAAAFGAALGDILPGESEGKDISDELDELSESLGIGDD